MCSLAANDAAKRHAAPVPSRPPDKAIGERETERQRDLEGARHGEPLIFDLPALELRNRAAGELIGNILVKARLDDQDRAWRLESHGFRIPAATASKLRWPTTLRP